MTKEKTKLPRKSPSRANDLPATVGLIKEFRSEMMSRFSASDRKSKSIDARFESVDKRFDAVDARFESLEKKMDSGFANMDSKFDRLHAEIHRIALLVENQNSTNKFVMDQYNLLKDKDQQHNDRINHIENRLGINR